MTSLCLFAFMVTLFVQSEGSTSERQCQPFVQSKVGKFCGKEENISQLENATVYAYLGIQYGEAPVGALRFKKPQPINRTKEEVVYATEYGPSCMQNPDTRFQSSAAIKMWGVTGNMSEDCLYLNVWVPKTVKDSNKKAGVLVWIHGGGFDSGSASLMLYDGKIFAAHQNVIVVSMNYRLAAFGFTYLSNTTIPGNMGLWDQHLALEWVKKNIRSFGGDPKRVTIMGQSSGAACVTAHMVARFKNPLFRNVIIQSSSILNFWASINGSEAINNTKSLSEKLGCTKTRDTEILECLSNKTSQEILRMDQESFKPARVGSFLPYADEEAFSNLSFYNLNGSLLAGINKNEGSLILLYALFDDKQFNDNVTLNDLVKNETSFINYLSQRFNTEKFGYNHSLLLNLFKMTSHVATAVNSGKQMTPGERLEAFVGDILFKCQTIKFANVSVQKQKQVYFYRFDYRTTNLPMPKWMGTYQGNELDYTFGMAYHEEFQEEFYSFTELERKISDVIMTYWGNFVKSGDPNIYLNDSNNIPPITLKEDGTKLTASNWTTLTKDNEFYLKINTTGNISTEQFPPEETCEIVNILHKKLPTTLNYFRNYKKVGGTTPVPAE